MTYTQTKLTAAREIKVQPQVISDDISAGHARLRMKAASLCGTDLHYYAHFSNAGFVLQNALSLGHEACAEVLDANGSDLKVGQLVALNPIMNCGECAFCQDGQENLCTSKKFPGSATTVPHLDGFFRDVIDHPVSSCVPVKDGVDPLHLTYAEPLACSMHAVTQSGAQAGDKMLVTGCGPMGLLAIAAAAAKGVEVTALDMRQESLDIALQVGAKHTLKVGAFDDKDIEKQFDVAIEASGAIPAMNTLMKALKAQATLAILSNIQVQQAESWWHMIMLKELNIKGSFQFNREFKQAVALIETGAIDFAALTAKVLPLSQVQEGLELMVSGGAFGKIVIANA